MNSSSKYLLNETLKSGSQKHGTLIVKNIDLKLQNLLSYTGDNNLETTTIYIILDISHKYTYFIHDVSYNYISHKFCDNSFFCCFHAPFNIAKLQTLLNYQARGAIYWTYGQNILCSRGWSVSFSPSRITSRTHHILRKYVFMFHYQGMDFVLLNFLSGTYGVLTDFIAWHCRLS